MLDAARKGRLPRKGVANPQAKLDDGKVREIRRLRAKGVGPTELGRQFGVHRSLIKTITKNRAWTHVV